MRAVLFAVLVFMSLIGARAEAATFEFTWVGTTLTPGEISGEVSFAAPCMTTSCGAADSLIFTGSTGTISSLIFGTPVADPSYNWINPAASGSNEWAVDPSGDLVAPFLILFGPSSSAVIIGPGSASGAIGPSLLFAATYVPSSFSCSTPGGCTGVAGVVPLPAAAWFLLSALGGLFGLGWIRKRRAHA